MNFMELAYWKKICDRSWMAKESHTQMTASVDRYPKYPICLAIVVMVSLMGPEEKVARRAACRCSIGFPRRITVQCKRWISECLCR